MKRSSTSSPENTRSFSRRWLIAYPKTYALAYWPASNPGPTSRISGSVMRVSSGHPQLKMTLNDAVAAAPESFAMAAEEFQELDPTYARALLDGLHQATRAKRAFAWDRPLKLARWVLQQPVEIPGRKGGLGDRDPSWAWCRTS